MKKKSLLVFLALLLPILPFWVMTATTCAMAGETLNATLAQMPIYAISPTEGVEVNFVQAISRVSGVPITISVNPFPRSMSYVTQEPIRADFHIPLIKNDIIPEDKLPYYYSEETIFHVNFTIYSLKGKDVNKDNLSKFKVETDAAHVGYFPFKAIPSNSIEQSLEKVSAGRIDAFVFADNATDPVLKKLGLHNIKRTLYKRFDVKIILPKTERGKQVDKILSAAIEKMRQTGEFQKIQGPIDMPYDDWQP
ncbi:MAG: transporter substrate-binding domain-containing protein [Syntrophobacteraceae bacterium]|nr:transporter substrate-binding domain-containing protein [Syntrophobacteraceae bacterium]